ncbi:MAG: transposase [Bacteroidota bacterium]
METKDIKSIEFDGLMNWYKSQFSRIQDKRADNKGILLSDALLSGFAMFSLKDRSLLYFDNKRTARKENLKKVYKIKRAPSDSGMRTILDDVEVKPLQKLFKSLVNKLRQKGFWKAYEYYQGHLICSVDGVHHFSSECIGCAHCLEYSKSNGKQEFRHYLLSGSIVHPDKKAVMPVIHEPILRQDGSEKNDCERNASKRLLPELRKQFPKEKMIIVEDALSANGPHIRALQAEDFRFVIGVKPEGNAYLFKLMDRMEAHEQGRVHHHTEQKDGLLHHYRYANDLPLNADNRDIRVNFITYRQVDPSGKKSDQVFSWITDFKLRKTNLYRIMRIGRSRWKIENETFNTLKNQAYNFEHNFGHGKNNLCTILVLLMMLAFFTDQIQQAINPLFIAAWQKSKSKIALWEEIRSKFNEFVVQSMKMIYLLIIGKIKVRYQFYQDSG